MKKEFVTVSKDEKIAVKEALTYFSQNLKRKVSKEEIRLVEVSEQSRFSFFGKKKKYVFELDVEIETKKSDAEIQEEEFFDDLNLDGYFKLKICDAGIFLKVVAPKGNGKPANLQHIKQMIQEKELVDVNYDLVEKALSEATGEFAKIAERKPELDRDAELLVKIASDGMEAYCAYLPPLGGRKLTFAEAIRILNEKGVYYGINEKKLKQLIEDNVTQEVLIAEGTPPIDGKPAQLRYHFQLPDEKKHVKELEDGSVDYRNLDLVLNVHKGDLLVTKIPPQPGTPGRTVTNKEVPPAQGKDVKLPKGKNVEIGADEMSLFAAIDGQIFLEQDKISVLPVYTVEGDVDLETGNINFLGNVIVKGNVQEGFSIKAEGDIEIMGNVGAAFLEAGGKIVIHKGFQGKQKGLIKADGDIHVNFIENGNAITRGSLYVNGAIMHSNVVAKTNVEVEGRGLIVGGTVQAGNDVIAKTIGSHLATPTEIMAGCDPEIRQQLEQINIEIDKATENMDKVVKGIELLRKVEKQLGKLPEEKISVLKQFDLTKSHLEEQMNSLLHQKEILSKQLKEQKNGRVKVLDRIHPGVRISIGQVGYRVKDSLARTAFVYDDGEVRPRPL